MENKQLFIYDIIGHEVDNYVIEQRIQDGYVNATILCKASNKNWADYYRLQSTQAFINELSSDMGIPISQLAQSTKGNSKLYEQGTWVHPQLAISLAQWLSPKFAVQVTKWVMDWIEGRITQPHRMSYHLERYLENKSKIPHTHFSVLEEVILGLIAPLERLGYNLPENIVPDISEGRMFASWLKKNGIDTSNVTTYEHTYPNGQVFDVRLYPNELLPAFRRHFYDVWLKTRSVDYFNERDKKAVKTLLQFLKQLESPKDNVA